MEAHDKIDSDTELLIRIDERTCRLQLELKSLSDKISANYVRIEEFRPVKAIAYGLVGVMLIAVVGAIVKLVL